MGINHLLVASSAACHHHCAWCTFYTAQCVTLSACVCVTLSLWIRVLTPIISSLLWTPLFLSSHTCSLCPDLWLTDHIFNIRRDTCVSKAVFSLSRFCFIPHLLLQCLPVVAHFPRLYTVRVCMCECVNARPLQLPDFHWNVI